MVSVVQLALLLLPGIFAWASGIKFVKMDRGGDFALRYFRHQQRIGLVFWFGLAVFFVVTVSASAPADFWSRSHKYTLGLTPIIVFLFAHAVFSLGHALVDQKVREETSSLAGRVAFNQVLLLFLAWPYVFIVWAAFASNRVAALTALALFGVCYFLGSRLWRQILAAQPLNDAVVFNRIRNIAGATGGAPPPAYVFSTRGMKYANVFAVGLWGSVPGIFFSEYAHAHLTPEELFAIYGHEVGHLRLHQVRRRSLAFLVPMILLTIVSCVTSPTQPLVQLLVLAGSFIFMRVLVPSQKFERDADLYGLQVSADPDNLVGALEKIYALGILPRRFAPTEEKRFSHPSLVQRIKHIRKTANRPAQCITESMPFAGQGRVSRVVFEVEGFVIEYADGHSEVHRYADILVMFPAQTRRGITLTVRYRNQGKPQRLNLVTTYAELARAIEMVEYQFADLPEVDPAQFSKNYYLDVVLAMLVGLTMALFSGPALLIISIVAAARKNPKALLAISVTAATHLLALAFTHAVGFGPGDTGPTAGVQIFLLAAVALICIATFFPFRGLKTDDRADGSLSFAFALAFTVIQLVGCVLVVALGLYHRAPSTWNMLVTNLAALAIGLTLLHSIADRRRTVVLLGSICILSGFILAVVL